MEGVRDRCGTLRLHTDNAWNARQPAELIEVFEAFMDSRDNIAVPHRDKDRQRRMVYIRADLLVPFLMGLFPPLPDFQRGSLLTFGREGIVACVTAVPAKLVRGFDR